MSYCNYCGKEIVEGAAFCTNCGKSIHGEVKKIDEANGIRGLKLASLILMFVGTFATCLSSICIPYVGWLFCPIPLAWCLPMTLTYLNKLKKKEPVSVGFKVCSLIFVSTVGGILMLVDTES